MLDSSTQLETVRDNFIYNPFSIWFHCFDSEQFRRHFAATIKITTNAYIEMVLVCISRMFVIFSTLARWNFFFFPDFLLGRYNFIICWIYRPNVCLQSHSFRNNLKLNYFPIFFPLFWSQTFDNDKKKTTRTTKQWLAHIHYIFLRISNSKSNW